MPMVALDLELRKEGYYPFVVLFTWDYEQDPEAVGKLNRLMEKLPEGIHRDSARGYYLTGQRTMIFVGHSNSPVALQKLCGAVTFNSPMEAELFHAVEVHELMDMVDPGKSNLKT